MAKNNNTTLYWIAGIIIIGFILYNSNPELFTVFTPKTPDKSLSTIVNKFYFPITTRTVNSDKCSIPSVKMGSTFDPNTEKFPTSGATILINGKYYKYQGGSTNRKDCVTIFGSQVLIDGNVPFKNFLLFKKGTNQYIMCQQTKTGSKYITLQIYNKVTSLPYTTPVTEQEGKYYCDIKAKTIYLIPCANGKKVQVQTCDLGCEQKLEDLDTGKIEVVKCKGDYKPNQVMCSPSGLNKFTTNASGALSTEVCCKCSGTTCDKKGCSLLPKGCAMLTGTTRNPTGVDIYFYNDLDHADYENFILTDFSKKAPYNEFVFNFYRENNKGDCKAAGYETTNDVRVGWEPIGAIGWGEPSPGKGVAANLMFNPTRYASISPGFLVYHELGHIYLHKGHSYNPADCTKTIMDYQGVSTLYDNAEIKFIRMNLNNPDGWTNTDSTVRFC